MAEAGLAEFSHSAESFDLDLLIEQLEDMERRAESLRRSLCSHNAALAQELERQFDELDDILFGRGLVRHAERASLEAETLRESSGVA
jgi:hypothetical protein